MGDIWRPSSAFATSPPRARLTFNPRFQGGEEPAPLEKDRPFSKGREVVGQSTDVCLKTIRNRCLPSRSPCHDDCQSRFIEELVFILGSRHPSRGGSASSVSDFFFRNVSSTCLRNSSFSFANGTTIRITTTEWNYRCFVVWFLFFFLIFFFFLFPFWFHVHYRQTHSGCAVERIRGEDAEPGSADRAHVRDATKSACIFQ